MSIEDLSIQLTRAYLGLPAPPFFFLMRVQEQCGSELLKDYMVDYFEENFGRHSEKVVSWLYAKRDQDEAIQEKAVQEVSGLRALINHPMVGEIQLSNSKWTGDVFDIEVPESPHPIRVQWRSTSGRSYLDVRLVDSDAFLARIDPGANLFQLGTIPSRWKDIRKEVFSYLRPLFSGYMVGCSVFTDEDVDLLYAKLDKTLKFKKSKNLRIKHDV